MSGEYSNDWEEKFDEESWTTYYYNATTNETSWEPPVDFDNQTDPYDLKLHDISTREYWLLTLLQAIVRGWYARRQMKWHRLNLKLLNSEKNANRFEKKGKKVRAIEEWEYSRHALEPHKNLAHLQPQWSNICRKLRHLCTSVQQELYWVGDRQKNEMDLMQSITSLKTGRHVITIFGKDTGLYKNRIPVLAVAECVVALRVVACRVATSMTMELKYDTKEILAHLESLHLDQYCKRASGVPQERWSLACNMTLPTSQRSRTGETKGDDQDENESSSSEEDSDVSTSEDEGVDGNGNSKSKNQKKNKKDTTDEEHDEISESENDSSDEEEKEEEEEEEEEDKVLVEDTLERRFLGTIRFCSFYIELLENYIEIDDLDPNLPDKKPIVGMEDEDVLILPGEEEDDDADDETDGK